MKNRSSFPNKLLRQLYKQALLSLLVCLVLFHMIAGTALAAYLAAPTARGGVESIMVSDFEPGAILKLYSSNGNLQATTGSVTDATYTFNDVVPMNTGYYVTQTVGAEESINSPLTHASLRTPFAEAGIGYVDITNVYPNAALTLYTSTGTPVSSAPVDQGGGIFRFEDLTARETYYVKQGINGVLSASTSQVTVLPPTYAAPTASGGVESIMVSDFEPGAILKLYLSNGNLQATTGSVTDATYTFNDVVPMNTGYYVTQTVGAEESINSPITHASLRTPVAEAGIGYVDITNVYRNAALTLYTSTGTPVSSAPVDQGGGIFRFEDLTARETYYVRQGINGVVSASTSQVTVLPPTYAAPTASGGVESIMVSDFEPGAILKLYSSNGNLQATTGSMTDATYTFNDVVPNNTGYYVTQTVGGLESINSSFTHASLRTPVAEAGIGYVDITNVYPNAALTLYTSTGTPVSSAPVDQGGGIFRFEDLTARETYYVRQGINGVLSASTSQVTVLPPTYAAPTASGGVESIMVSDFEPGAILKLYSSNGNLQATTGSVTDATYTFNDVVPNNTGYYVTQTVGAEESINSPITHASLRTPVAEAGIGYVDITNVYPNAALTLYTSTGTPVSSAPVDQGGGIFRFEDLTARETYYVRQGINGVLSASTSQVTVLPPTYAAPTASGGVESIMVSDFEPGAILKLYSSNGNLQATTGSMTDATYTFNDVVPMSTGYYVTQTVGAEESINSPITHASLRTPVAEAGIGYVDITNVYPNAALTLYTSAGTPVSGAPVDQGGGIFRFEDLTARETYYVKQGINGVLSASTSHVTVLPPTYAAPTASGGVESIMVSDFEPGAILKLYTSNSNLQATTGSVTDATYTFNDVVPMNTGYYVTQTVGAEESINSPLTHASLRTPVAEAGIGYVDITNVYPNAALTLYTSTGTPVSSAPVDQGGGIFRFEDLTARETYYVRQGINGVLSASTSQVTVLPPTYAAPTHVTAIAGNRQAVVSFHAPDNDGGNTITSYEVTAFPGSITATGATSPITVTGLSNGTSYTFTVKAINAVGSSDPSDVSNAVTPRSSSSGGYTGTTTRVNGDLQLNGKSVDIGTVVNSELNGQLVTTVSLDQKRLENELLQQDTQIASISVNRASDVLVIEADGELIKSLINKRITLEIRTPQAVYTLPAERIDVDALAADLGSSQSFKQIKIAIQIGVPSAVQLHAAESAVAQQGLTLVVPPVEFIIQASYEGETVKVTTFHAYVERTLTLPDGVDTSKVTTGIVIEPDGKIRHVPTLVFEKDGKAYAKINSLTNSMYSVIWNPIAFHDVQTHWGKDAVNDMGSRLVIEGTGSGLFSPEHDITRAEFAAILVRGLGLSPQSGATVFSDVQSSDWYNGYVQAVHAYGLIGGFEDGTFRPNDRITREQAMLMIAKAMTLTNLQSQLPAQSTEQVLKAFRDADQASVWAIDGIVATVQAGIISGRSSSELQPKEFMTRAEVAAIIQRLLQFSKFI